MSTNGTSNVAVAQELLDTLFGKVPAGDIVIWALDRETRQKQSNWMDVRYLRNAGKVAEGFAQRHETYFGVSVQSREASVRVATEREAERAAREKRAPWRITAGNTRGFNCTAAGLTFLWADVDVANDGHKKSSDLPPDMTAAMALVEVIGLKPSVLVGSGGGLHAYWILRTPWMFQSDDDRRRATELSKSWQRVISDLAAGHGWITDSTFDLARVLRVPGTLNHKLETPRPVEIIASNDNRYRLSDFEDVISRSELARPPAPPARQRNVQMPHSPFGADADRAFQRCMAYVARIPRAVSGYGGHDMTLRAACECFRFGLDDADARRVMEWFNATQCDPPWSQREIDHKLEDGRKKVAESGEIGVKLREDRRGGQPRRLNLTIAPLRAGAST